MNYAPNPQINGESQMKNLIVLTVLTLLISCGRQAATDFAEGINASGSKHFTIIRTYGANGNSNYTVFKDEATGKMYAVNVESFKSSGLSAEAYFANNMGTGLVVEIASVTSHTETYSTSESVPYTVYEWEEYGRDYISEEDAMWDGYDGYDEIEGSYYVTLWEEVEYTEYETVVTYHDVSVNDYNGTNGVVFEEGQSTTKDLETMASNIEGKDAADLALDIESKFGLSSDRSLKVASLQLAYNKLSSKRSLTSKDQDIFSKQLIGTDYKTAKSALEGHIQGDSADMDNVLDQAAELNGTSPEHMTELLGDILVK